MKMTIYIPSALHEQMRSAGDAVNWSRIAQQAWEKHLAATASAIKPRNEDTSPASSKAGCCVWGPGFFLLVSATS